MAGNFTSDLTNSTNLLDMMVALNNHSSINGWFGHLFLITIFIVMLIAMKNYTMMRAIAAASFMSFIFAVLLNIAGLVPELDVTILMIITIISIVGLYLER